ncbi:MAG: undecaprenyl-diphosphate phosphatase [Gammaproteobacteria bacterium HGW-Gammaproteobacteria-4]|jgi:undecaprenyl-diphosphatase|nr:MAG: undecaprenyl-diphosphate phosphatase [Gammaproteobacteria bacterium HGW-Gammaproteobacteria-4]
MDYLIAALLGIIEGITEFLPISSTGHLLIAEYWLGHQSDLFNIVIQAGAIVAVTAIYRQRVWALLTGLRDPETRRYALKLALAFTITAVLGLVVTQLGFKLPETVTPVALALVLGGVWMIVAERLAERRPASTQITWTVAIAVGLAQVVAAIFPGTSRSSATIFIALLVGTGDRKAATEFAFLVGIPTMFAASGYHLLKHLGAPAQENWSALGVAFVASTITAFVAVKWLLGYIQSHRFTAFAVYRIVLGVVLLLWLPVGG